MDLQYRAKNNILRFEKLKLRRCVILAVSLSEIPGPCHSPPLPVTGWQEQEVAPEPVGVVGGSKGLAWQRKPRAPRAVGAKA